MVVSKFVVALISLLATSAAAVGDAHREAIRESLRAPKPTSAKWAQYRDGRLEVVIPIQRGKGAAVKHCTGEHAEATGGSQLLYTMSCEGEPYELKVELQHPVDASRVGLRRERAYAVVTLHKGKQLSLIVPERFDAAAVAEPPRVCAQEAQVGSDDDRKMILGKICATYDSTEEFDAYLALHFQVSASLVVRAFHHERIDPVPTMPPPTSLTHRRSLQTSLAHGISAVLAR